MSDTSNFTTPAEKAGINRRIADALGWRWWRGQYKGLSALIPGDTGERWHFWPESPKGEDYVWEAGVEPPADAMKFFHVPYYCGSPSDADLVRQEIERRGWVWSISPGIDDDKYFSMVTGGTVRCSKPPYGLATSKESPWHALCLAFLAAHEEKV